MKWTIIFWLFGAKSVFCSETYVHNSFLAIGSTILSLGLSAYIVSFHILIEINICWYRSFYHEGQC